MNEIPVWERRYRAPTVSFPTWSQTAPDRLVYLSTESGAHQVWTCDHDSGERRRVSDEAVGVTVARPTADGSGVVWFQDATGDEAGRYVVAPFEGGDPRALLPDVPEGWSGGVVAGERVIAVAVSTATGFSVHASAEGRPARELYRHPIHAALPRWDQDASHAALSADETLLCIEHAEHGDVVRPGLLVIDPRTGATVGEQWDGEGLGLQAAAWSPIPGDQRLAIVHEREGEKRAGIWDLATGERHDLPTDLRGDVDVLGWWPDATALIVVVRAEGRDLLHRLDLADRRLTAIPHLQGAVSGAAVRPDGTLWYRIANGATAPRVLDEVGRDVLPAGGEPAPVGRPYQSWSFENSSGQRVHGFFVTPAGDPPFPVVMWVHGGPSWLYADDWNPDVQAFVDEGFAVGMVNYRGSTGYGPAWRDALVGDIGFPEIEDILAGLDDLAGQGLVDPARAVVGGFSWGGYITLLMLGVQPGRFAAGIAGVPVGDYAACYADLSPPLQAYDRYLLGGTLEEKAKLVRERSPITYVDRVRSPVLCLIAENDTRCPPRQAYLYVDALRARGGEVEVYSYATGHSAYVVDEEVRHTRTMLDFLARRVQ